MVKKDQVKSRSLLHMSSDNFLTHSYLIYCALKLDGKWKVATGYGEFYQGLTPMQLLFQYHLVRFKQQDSY